ncbi:MAG: hypothetical protein QW620_03225 [Thermoplasmata archaeon]
MRKIIAFLLVLLLLPVSYIYFESQGKQYASAPMDYKTNVTKAETPRTMFLHDNTTESPRLIVNDTIGDKPATYYESIKAGANKTWEMYPPLNQSRYVDNIYTRLYLEPRLELEGLFGAVPDTRGLQHGILNFSGDVGSAKINGTSSSQAGFSVAVVDLNNDGYDDVVIGAPYNNSSDGSKPGCGAVFIFLGKPYFDVWNDTVNATVTIWGATAGDHFGWSVANGSDLNGDGVYDLIVGAPDNSSSKGSVYVFFGNTTWDRNSTAQHFYEAWRDSNGTFVGESPGDKFGWSVAGCGDVNGTGNYGDFVVGAPNATVGYAANAGKAYVFLGDGVSIWSPTVPISATNANLTLKGEIKANELFGYSVAGIGNTNGDAWNDFVVGAPGRNKAYVYNGDPGIRDPQTGSYNHTTVVDFNAQFKYNVNVTTIDSSDGDVILADVGHGTHTHIGLASVNGSVDVVDEITTSGSYLDTQVVDGVGWNVTEAGTKTFFASSEKTKTGVRTNDYAATFSSDNTYEQLTELQINSGITDTLITYGEYTYTPLDYSVWDGSGWGSETPDGTFAATIENVRAKSNPARNEIVVSAVAGDNTAPSEIWVNVWNGTTNTWYTPRIVTDYAYYVPAYRQHDIAFETLSGDAIIFYSGGPGPTIYYQIWNGTAWSEPNSYTLSTITGNIYWIEAASDPYTDEIALLVADSNSDAAGIIWNGTNFWSEQLLTQTLSIATEQCHDVVYESISGYAMFVWGVGTNMNSRRWLNGSWEAPLTAVNVGGTCNWFSIKADPLSNRLVVVSVDGLTDLNTVRWSGSSWTLDTEHDASVETNAGRCADAVFETQSGHAGHIILVYGDSTNTVYKHWDGTSWSSPVNLPNLPAGDTFWSQLRCDANGLIFYAECETDWYLNTWTWDGSAWTWRKTHSTSLSQYSNPTEAFMLAPSLSLKPGSRLEHKWNFSLNTGGVSTRTLTFYVKAYKTSNSENDNFVFYYSPTGEGEVGSSGWTQMVTVTKTSDDGLYQSFSIGSYSREYIWVGVKDTDRTVGNNNADTLYIDHMYINATITPMFSVVFKFSGLTASYTSMRLNFTGYRGNLSSMETDDGISFEIWNETQKRWINDTGISAFWNDGFVNATYLSTNTWIYQNITNGNLYVRIRNWNVSSDTADCWLWIDFFGIDVNSASARFADYGVLTQKSPATTTNPILSAMATWSDSNALGIRYFNRTIITQGDYIMQRPFGGLNYNAMRMQLIIPQSDLLSYGIVDKIWFHADATDSDGDGVIASLNNFKVYLCHTKRSPTAVSSVFEDNYGGNTPMLVFSAQSFSFKEDGTWQAIDLDDIFCYDNVSNLLIEIRWSGDNGVIARAVGDDNYPTVAPYQFVYSGCESNKTGVVLTFQYDLGFNFTLPKNLRVSLSRDNGTTWYEVQNGVEFYFTGTESVQNKIKYRLEFWSQNLSRNDSAILHWINISYNANVDTGKTPLIGDPNTKFGFSTSGFTDFNGDSNGDVIVGAPGPPAIDYKYVTSNFTIAGTITGFLNATDDDADNATLAEQFVSQSSFPSNHEFNTSADGWTSARSGGDDVAITNAYDSTYGNPAGAIYTRLERRWTNFETNGIGIWEAQFNHYLGQPLTATLEFSKRVSQWGAAGTGPRYFKVSVVAPNSTELVIYQSTTITGTDASWVKISQTISSLSFFQEVGTYTLRITTYLSLAASNRAIYQRVNYDNIFLNLTFNPTHVLDIEFTTSDVRPSSDFYLEINYTASGEDFYLYIYNGSAWNKRVTLYKTPGIYTVYTYTLLFEEWNYGLVRVRFTDSETSGDTVKNYLNISYFRIRYNSAGNTYLYYGNYLSNETRIFHDELGDFTSAENYTDLELTGGNISLLKTDAINDEFDSDTPGGNPTGWTLTENPPNENIFVVSNTSYPSGGNSVAIYDNLTTNKPGSDQGVCMYKTFSPLKQGVVDLWVNHTSGQIYLFMFASGYNPTYPVIEIVLYGWISAYNGYGWVDMDSYTLNTWWNLKIIFNSDTDTYNVYKNGVLIGENITYFNDYGALDTLSIETWDTTTCIGYVDSINVYSYKTNGVLYSQEISGPDYIYNVFTYWNATKPAYTYINVSVSRDNGNTWALVSNNSTYWFTNNEPENKIFRYRIELGTSHAAYTPTLYNITFSFNRSRMGVIITGNVSLEGFGFSVSGGGDFDNDGYRDILLGAPYAANNRGNIYAFYGSPSWTFQTHLYATYADITFEGENTGDMYGYSVYGRVIHITNNTTGEWYNEVLCGAPLWDDHGTNCGRVYLYIARGLPYVNVTWWFYDVNSNANVEIGYWNLGRVGRTGWWNGTANITNPQTVEAGVAINMTINVTSPTGHASVRVYYDSVERCSGYTFMPGGAGMAETEWVKVKKNGVLSNSYITTFTASDSLYIVANISVVPGYNVSEVKAAIIRVINDTSGAVVLENQTLINPETTGTNYKIFVLYDVAHSWPAGLYKIEVDAQDSNGATDYGRRFANNKVCYIYITG